MPLRLLTMILRRLGSAGALALVATMLVGRTVPRHDTFGLEPSRRARARRRAREPAEQTDAVAVADAQPVTSRWLVFCAYGVLAAATQALLVNYAPVTDDAAHHFGVSVAAVGWLSQIFPLVFVLLAIPAGLALDRFLRPALVLGAALTAGGAFLRLVADDFTWAMTGQLVAAVGQPFVLCAIPGLAVGYLAEKDRGTGIALASSATFMGMVLGYLLGAFMPGEGQIHALTLITALVALDAALCVVGALYFAPHAGVPAVTKTGGVGAFRAAFGNPYIRRLCAVVAVPMGTFIALATFAQPLLKPAGVSESMAGSILALTLITGVVGCAFVPVWAQRHGREVHVMRVGVAFTAVACLHLALVPSTAMAFITLLAVGFALLPALPIVLTLGEQHSPGAENTAAGCLWMAGNLGGVLLATVAGLLVHRPGIAFATLSAATLLALPALRWFSSLDRAPAV